MEFPTEVKWQLMLNFSWERLNTLRQSHSQFRDIINDPLFAKQWINTRTDEEINIMISEYNIPTNVILKLLHRIPFINWINIINLLVISLQEDNLELFRWIEDYIIIINNDKKLLEIISKQKYEIPYLSFEVPGEKIILNYAFHIWQIGIRNASIKILDYLLKNKIPGGGGLSCSGFGKDSIELVQFVMKLHVFDFSMKIDLLKACVDKYPLNIKYVKYIIQLCKQHNLTDTTFLDNIIYNRYYEYEPFKFINGVAVLLYLTNEKVQLIYHFYDLINRESTMGDILRSYVEYFNDDLNNLKTQILEASQNKITIFVRRNLRI